MAFQPVVSVVGGECKGAALTRRCLCGDEDAWRTLVRSVAGPIFCLCYRFTYRREEAEDITQEVHLRVYRKMAEFREGAGSLQAWVLAIARNAIIDHHRQVRNERDDLGTKAIENLNLVEERSPDPLHAAERAETSEIVRYGLGRLPPDLRQAVLLRDIEGMEYHEIASDLGLPEGTVKSRVNRAHLRLAKTMRARVRRRWEAGTANISCR